MFSNNPGTSALLQIPFDVCAHSSLLTSAIIVQGLLKRKEEHEEEITMKMNNFCVGGKNTSSAVLKVFTNTNTSVKTAWKYGTAKKNRRFCRDCLWDAIRLAIFSVDPGILLSLWQALNHHPYTTLANGEWMISWPGEESPVEVRSTESATILFPSHPYS